MSVSAIVSTVIAASVVLHVRVTESKIRPKLVRAVCKQGLAFNRSSVISCCHFNDVNRCVKPSPSPYKNNLSLLLTIFNAL